MTNRREFLAAAALGALGAGCRTDEAGTKPDDAGVARGAFRYALNPATIRGYKCSLKEQVRLCIEAGYEGIEPWLVDIQAAKDAGELADIRKMCADGNLAVVNGIGFAHWAMPDPQARAKGMEEMKRDMALVAELGGAFIAAPPFGLHAPGSPKVDLDSFARDYRAVLELGGRMGVTPILEFWGASANLSRLNEALYVAAASGHANAAVLADVYHMYRGGSPYEGLRFCTKSALPVLHMNDVPAMPAREQLTDADRVWPGDGIAPWRQIKGILRAGGLNPWLSIELFNKSYWTTTPLDTLKTGLAKMKAVI
ncbi:MAG: sugar phosphate isomerase/epimerase family protein [Kiritimatiellia bacterium]